MSTALTTRQEFGAQESTHALVETASTAIAAKAKAMVEARYVMALQAAAQLGSGAAGLDE
jgi:hypothetical protein